MKPLQIFTAPPNTPEPQRRNFINVQIDAIGVGIVNAAAPFLAVFLARLGASNFQVGLLSSMPAVTGLLMAIPLGRYLQKQAKIIPWFSGTRLTVILCYTMSGLITLILPPEWQIVAVLAIWAFATIPQTILAISFSVVMNAVAGPSGRYELMSRRWSIMGFTTSMIAIILGQMLDRISFPLNYQLMFMGVSIGGFISYYFSSHLILPPATPPPTPTDHTVKSEVKAFTSLIFKNKPFISFMLKRFVYLTGGSMIAPLFPIYFVRTLKTSDSWIATINMVATATVIIGYLLWMQQSRLHGSRRTLLWSTFGLSLDPILTSFTSIEWPILIYAGLSGVFQAGLNLVFFDELMKTIPPEYSATYVSTSQSLEYLSAVVSPLVGTLLADSFGVSLALLIGGLIRLSGFALFFLDHHIAQSNPSQA